MVLTLEKISRTHKFEQIQADIQILLKSLNFVASDTKSIKHKIVDLISMRESLLENTDIDSLSDKEASKFIGRLSEINAQIELLEIAVGDKDLNALLRAGRRFAQKTRSVIGMTD
jgi:hypothetical protein